MKANLTIELELLEPLIVGSAAQLQDLHPSQIRWVSIRLTADAEDAEAAPVRLEAKVDDARLSIRELIAFVRKAQPKGTSVLVWFQGRSESFLI